MNRRTRQFFQRLVSDCRGQDFVEYALILGFIAVAGAATFPPIAEPVGEIFSKVQSLTDGASGV